MTLYNPLDLYVKWTPKPYTITYNANSGTPTSSAAETTTTSATLCASCRASRTCLKGLTSFCGSSVMDLLTAMLQLRAFWNME